MKDSVKTLVFRLLHGFRGYPRKIRGRMFRVDESLRRFHTDGEEAIQETLEKMVPVGGFFVDIGANFGLHTLLACDLLGPGGRVLAVEPVPANLSLLRRNLALNGYDDRCTVAGLALTNGSVASVEMTVEPGLSPAASLAENFAGIKILVLAGTLDTLLAGVDAIPDLIKIDVEGAEHEVLKGAIETLRKGPALLIEVHRFALGNFGSSSDALVAFLANLGYQEHRLSEMESHLGEYHHSLFLKDHV